MLYLLRKINNMLRKINKMSELENIFNEALKEHEQTIAVELTIPGQKDVEYIVKLPKFEWIQEAIYIHIGRSWRGNIELPTFKKEAMYKGMKINKRYTLEKIESRMELPKCSPMFAIG